MDALPPPPPQMPFPLPSPPGWLVAEIQQRVILLVNHVLQQEPQAMQKLAGQSGKRLMARWLPFQMPVRVTPAGLFELIEAAREGEVGTAIPPDLVVELASASPVDLMRSMWRNERPPVRIEGDVQLATEIGWIADHVRWDIEEDLSRVVGDGPAHALATAARKVRDALRAFGPDGKPPA